MIIKELYLNTIKRVLVTLCGVVIGISSIPTIGKLSVQMTCFAKNDSGEESQVIVSMGDSYSSGEGIEPFYGQYELDIKKKVENPDWLAHRSKDAWPGMLTLPSVDGKMSDENNKGKKWFFVAASGATTDNIKYNFVKEYKQGKYEGKYILDPQLDIFDEIGEKKADYVTLTLGGNDAGFSDVITECSCFFLKPGTLTDRLNNTWEMFFANGGIRDRLKDAYVNIAEKAGSQAQIIVAGYPRLLDENGSSLGNIGITKDEANKVNANVSKFNNAIENVVHNCQGLGMKIHFVSVEDAFEGHGAFSEEPYINGIIPHLSLEASKKYGLPETQDLDDSSLGVSAYSIHPNFEGACAYAKCVQDKIDELEKIETTNKYNTKFQIAVYDKNDYLYGNYVIKIEGKEFDSVFMKDFFAKDYSKTISVDTAKKIKINLPKGDYTITVTDGDNEDIFYKKNVLIRPNSKNDSLVFRTDFGKTDEQESDNIWTDRDVSTYSPSPQDTNPFAGEKTLSARNVVLTLDVSGSMGGIPLEETKKASAKFINTVLGEDANIGVVTYNEMSEIASGFSIDKALLQNMVTDLYAGGGTNIEAGLRDAQWMLKQADGKKKIIVLMSDGEPNTGLVDEELIAYADEIKKSGVMIYTVGFFESLSEKSYAQYLMEQIASDGCHYEVANADELVFFFEDMADQINGQKYIYVRIACPVDVSVTYDGETLDSSEKNLNARTSFGTLTFEENNEDAKENEDDRVKVLRLKEGVNYDLEITGTGHGVMNYTIGFMDDNGDYSDIRKFRNIKITRKTKIDTVASNSDDSVLNIDENGDGKYDLKLRAEVNGYGKEMKNLDWIIYVILGVAALVLIDIVAIIIYVKRIKRRKVDN